MESKIERLIKDFHQAIVKVENSAQLDEVRITYLGKNAELNQVVKEMRNLDENQKRTIGQLVNETRSLMTEKINELATKFNQEKLNAQLAREKLNVTLPGKNHPFGSWHPLNLVINEIATIFEGLGFQMVNGSEVDTDLFNFQKLNLPEGHPAREMQDTFYLDEQTVLRTHSTNMTAHLLTRLSEQGGDYLAAISYGNVYRRDDDDATHSHQFMQIDGFVVGKNISFANLKWILTYLCQRLFNVDVKVRFRPSYFPFTQPSVEADIACFKCHGQGCELCKQSGWIEVLGAGLIHDEVFQANGLDPQGLSGLAFGIGVERIAMLKFGITNIRDFYENNLQFLNQFKFYGN